MVGHSDSSPNTPAGLNENPLLLGLVTDSAADSQFPFSYARSRGLVVYERLSPEGSPPFLRAVPRARALSPVVGGAPSTRIMPGERSSQGNVTPRIHQLPRGQVQEHHTLERSLILHDEGSSKYSDHPANASQVSRRRAAA